MPCVRGTIGDSTMSIMGSNQPLFGYRDGVQHRGAMNALLLPAGNTFIADTYVNNDPTPEQLAEITLMAAESVRRFGIEPRVAAAPPTSVPLTARPAKQNARSAGAR